MISVMEKEASDLRSIHSSCETLRGPTTSSDPMGIMDWGGVHETQDVVQHDLRIKGLNDGNEICHLSKMSLNISMHSRCYPSRTRYKHYASR